MAGLSGVDGKNRGKIFSISKAVKPGISLKALIAPRMSHFANVVQLTSQVQVWKLSIPGKGKFPFLFREAIEHSLDLGS
jgi:hypothetical protein